MKTIITATAFVVALSGFTSIGSAGEFDKHIKARKGVMQVYAFNLGQLVAMAKGETAYDAKAASAAAGNLLAAVNMQNGAMWPKGSDAGAQGKMTRAKAEIWTTYPKIGEKAKALNEAVTAMSAAAGNGLDAVRKNIGAVGKGCKGCHEAFRVPKE